MTNMLVTWPTFDQGSTNLWPRYDLCVGQNISKKYTIKCWSYDHPLTKIRLRILGLGCACWVNIFFVWFFPGNECKLNAHAGRLQLIIDREAREIIRLVASVRLSVRPSVRPSIRLSVRLSVRLSALSRLNTMCMLRSGRYMGSACRGLSKNTMTYEIQSKTSVCLSIINERSRSKSCAQRSGAFNFEWTNWKTLFNEHRDILGDSVQIARIVFHFMEYQAKRAFVENVGHSALNFSTWTYPHLEKKYHRKSLVKRYTCLTYLAGISLLQCTFHGHVDIDRLTFLDCSWNQHVK